MRNFGWAFANLNEHISSPFTFSSMSWNAPGNTHMIVLRERPSVRLFETWVKLTNKQRSGLKGDTWSEIMWVSKSPLESLNEHWRMRLSCHWIGQHTTSYGFPHHMQSSKHIISYDIPSQSAEVIKGCTV